MIMEVEPEESFELKEYRKSLNPMDSRDSRNKSIMFDVEMIS